MYDGSQFGAALTVGFGVGLGVGLEVGFGVGLGVALTVSAGVATSVGTSVGSSEAGAGSLKDGGAWVTDACSLSVGSAELPAVAPQADMKDMSTKVVEIAAARV